MHGGTVARSYEEQRTAQYYFCSGPGDSSVARCVPSPFLFLAPAYGSACCIGGFQRKKKKG
ncbi:hypothetical protein B0F90DRAFT_1739641, partial [Multifurca ochricompacta]